MKESVWRVNVKDRTVRTEPVPDAWSRLGGRGLTARILLDETPPTCHPLGPLNKLLFAPGLLVGHMISSCDRISVGCKSPLTRGVKEANAGGTTGLRLARLGVKALILEGEPTPTGWWVVHLSTSGGRFESAGDLAGLGVNETARRLSERYGKKVALALIGPGGERRLSTAGIQNLDKNGEPSRIAARGGVGAVMGAKRIKAIVVDDAGGQPPPLHDPVLHRDAARRFTKALMAHPQIEVYAKFGTAAMARMCQALGALPTRGFSAGRFEGMDAISGEHLREVIEKRGGDGEPTHGCMPGCVSRCSNVYADAEGHTIVSPLEYETIGLVGSNLGIADLDTIARINAEINDLGLDSIDIGAALGVAAQADLMAFGDGKRALEIVREIREDTTLGRVIGHGAAMAAEVFGVTRVPVVKRQAMSAYDPRAIKGTGVTYATSPQGADHTAGLTIRLDIEHRNPAGQAKYSLDAQLNMAGYDTLGACTFAGPGFATAPGAIRDLVRARCGWDPGDDALQNIGRDAIRLELAYNRAAGLTAADDRLPEWMTREPLSPFDTVFDVPDADLDGVFEQI